MEEEEEEGGREGVGSRRVGGSLFFSFF